MVKEQVRNPDAKISPDMSLQKIVGLMTDGGYSALTIIDGDSRPIGIVTEQDIVRRAAFSAAPDQPVKDIMTMPVEIVPEDAYLFVAINNMRRLGHRHLSVVDANGRFTGMLDLHQTLAAAARDLTGLIEQLMYNDSVDGLKEIKAAQVDMAQRLFAGHTPAVEIQALLTHINNDIYGRVTDINITRMTAEGAAPPRPFSLIVMGSGGRNENFLTPDQDYGFVIADGDDDNIDEYYVQLAQSISDDLDAIGLPYCDGDVMATNDLWRKTASQWQAQIDDWNIRCQQLPLLYFDIFFDFRSAWGLAELAAGLRHHVTKVTRGNAPFLRALHNTDRDHNTALRWFGRFATEKQSPAHRGKINLKLHGTLPLVESARLLCLREGIEEQNTHLRLSALHTSGILKDGEFENLNAAYDTLSDILIHRQVADFEAGHEISNFVHPKRLNRMQKGMLRASFHAIEDLRQRVAFEIGHEVF